MNDTWGTPETQPPETTPHQPVPQLPRYEYAWLGLGVSGVTSSLALFAIDHLSGFDFSRGGYSILTGLSVLGGCGWLVRSRESRLMAHNRGCADRLVQQLADLAAAVERLERQVARPTYQSPKRSDGHRCAGTSAIVEGDTVPLAPKVDRPQPADRDAVLEEGFDLGYRARDAEQRVTRLRFPKRPTHG